MDDGTRAAMAQTTIDHQAKRIEQLEAELARERERANAAEIREEQVRRDWRETLEERAELHRQIDAYRTVVADLIR